ncbi:MAG: hypothetical protein ACRDQA_05815, partial [Nocardioidaceae bacterium]
TASRRPSAAEVRSGRRSAPSSPDLVLKGRIRLVKLEVREPRPLFAQCQVTDRSIKGADASLARSSKLDP